MLNEIRSAQTTFRAVAESFPDEAWRRSLHAYWPAYRRWWHSRAGGPPDVGLGEAQHALARWMPELMPTYWRLVELADGDPEVARFLTLFRPPPFAVSCSQSVWRAPGRSALVRNYDFGPDLFEGLIVSTGWRGRVIGCSECLWGLDDGVNEEGLAVSITFGGSLALGDGFGIPLVVRYLLETCSTTPEAVRRLCSIPVNMAYNVSILDREGRHRTVALHPRRKPLLSSRPFATNHQRPVERPHHAASIRSLERYRALVALSATSLSLEDFQERFLKDPLYSRDWRHGFGTLYTVAYDTQSGLARFRWPGAAVDFGFDDFPEGSWRVEYQEIPRRLDSIRIDPSSAVVTERMLGAPRAEPLQDDGLVWAAFAEQLAGMLGRQLAGGVVDWSSLASRWRSSVT